MATEAATELKKHRSALRAKVTSAARRLKGIHNSSNNDLIHSAMDSLNRAYEEFCIVDIQYVELVQSDQTTFADFITVGNLGLEQYSDYVSDVYNEALSSFTAKSVKSVENSCALATSDIKKLISELSSVLTKSDPQLATMLLHKASDTISKHKRLLDELANSSNSGFALELGSFITDLEFSMFKVELMVSNIDRAPAQPSDRHSDVSDSTNQTPHTQINSVSLQQANQTVFTPNTGAQSRSRTQSMSSGSDPAAPGPLSGGSDVSASGGGSGAPNGALNSGDASSVVHSYAQHTPVLSSTSIQTMQAQSQSCQSRRRYKELPIPTFDGDRLKWGDFKVSWNKYAKSELEDDLDKARALSSAIKGKACKYIGFIKSNQPNAYNRMWDKLLRVYEDESYSVQFCLDQLQRLKKVKEGDYPNFVEFVNQVESVFCQLGDINQVDYIALHEVDNLSDLLPSNLQWEWLEVHRKLIGQARVRPFSTFMSFLEDKRDAALRMSERNALKSDASKPKAGTSSKSFHSLADESHASSEVNAPVNSCHTVSDQADALFCAVHKSNKTHDTLSCRVFKSMSRFSRTDALRKAGLCFRCFGRHLRNECNAKITCEVCKVDDHHTLMCRKSNKSGYQSKPKSFSEKTSQNCATSEVTTESNASTSHITTESFNLNRDPSSIYALNEVQTLDRKQKALVFFDGGSDSSYVTHATATRTKARKLKRIPLNVLTMGGGSTEYDTWQYEVQIRTADGELRRIRAYGMEVITSPVKPPDMKKLAELFPGQNLEGLKRESTTVDILLGNDHLGLHPEVILATAGENLRLSTGPLGLTVQGVHPDLTTCTTLLIDTANTHVVVSRCNMLFSAPHAEFRNPPCTCLAMKNENSAENFILGDELATEITPKCGGCKCGNCPVVGNSYSFREQQELDLIRQNLRYDEDNKRWITKYPWIRDPNLLPNNYSSAFATLKSTERTLRRDPAWAKIYADQIRDMEQRQVCRKLTKLEQENWSGPIFYISHLAVKNPKSTSTPVRIVFNSSQTFQGASLNGALAKGPDAYLNNLIGILLRWREGAVGLTADIRKMYNSVYIEELEQHTHRFLWRDMEDREPDVYVILRVNMGDRPAGAISTEALYKTAELFKERYPDVYKLLLSSTYVDDIIDSVPDFESALSLARNTNSVLSEAGFKTKHWQIGKESAPRVDLDSVPTEVGENITRVLGVCWETSRDRIVFHISLNFSKKKGGVYTEPDLQLCSIPKTLPNTLTRRKVLEQVMKVFDPLGLLCPFLLTAKYNLRETWTQQLKWDDILPETLHKRWVVFFSQLASVSELQYNRCIKPENSDGKPTLIIFCDGSELAYGAAVFVRWKLLDGSFSSQLVFAKNRIAPIKKISIPQMELNGTVIAKRVKKVVDKEMRYDFERIIYLTDSEVVLSQLNNISTRFKLYEGVRIGEVQAACDGDMTDWHWVEGKQNIADWLTRPKTPTEIGPTSIWNKGPEFLGKPVEDWPIKCYSQLKPVGSLPGEKVHSAKVNNQTHSPLVDYSRFSSHRKLLWTLGLAISALKTKFQRDSSKYITPAILQQAQAAIIKDVQSTMTDLQTPSKGRYKQLKPVLNEQGLWVIGGRLTDYNPFTPDSVDSPQYLLPSDHPYTRLAMVAAHVECGHRGRDSTLARFRYRFWTPQGSKLANAVKTSCQKCKLRDPQLIQQEMAQLPMDRLKPAPPFNKVMLDYFGPYAVRGEVQKRVTGKVWAVCFTDLCSRAVHIEPVYGYDTKSFMYALCRFTSLRGWPEVIYSDPGSQLIGADRELTEAWKKMEKNGLLRMSTFKGTTWKFGAADSPWRQGAVESLIKSIKRCFKFTLDNRRVSPSEFDTICYQVANMLNERPIGVLTSSDSVINLLTPNCLLLGRSLAENPGYLFETKSYDCSVVNEITQNFWKRWNELYLPSVIKQSKWMKSSSNLSPGDIVLVSDSNAMRGQYTIAKVKEVFPGPDGKVRTVSLVYKNYRAGERVAEYHGKDSDRTITRSVQRLALLVPAQYQGSD